MADGAARWRRGTTAAGAEQILWSLPTAVVAQADANGRLNALLREYTSTRRLEG